MRIGYLLDTHKGSYGQPVPNREDAASTIDALIEEAVVAEKAGFHSIQVPERINRTETYFPGVLQLLTILARETEKVAIGSYSMVNTIHHPMEIAQQAALIDNISRGRLFMTFARGYNPDYWGFTGIPEERLLSRFLENLSIIKKTFEGKKFSYEGEFYSVVDGVISPRPYQSPHYPIWGGGQVPESIRRCAEYATCWTGDDHPIDNATWLEQVRPYRERARELGKEPFVVLMRNGWVADDYASADSSGFLSHYVEEMKFYSAQGILKHHPEFDTPEKISAEGMRPHIIAGSAAECIEKLERYEDELGIDYFTIRVRMPAGPSLAQAKEQIMRFGEEVVSHFHKRPALNHPAIPEGARW